MFGKKHKQSSTEKMSKSGKGKHSQPKTPKFKEHLRSLYSGKTYEERYGIEKANEMIQNLKKPKSDKHKEAIKNSPYHANRPKFPCIHCSKLVHAPALSRYHNDNCKLRPK